MKLKNLIHELDEAVFPSSIYCIRPGCGRLIDRSRTYSLCDECIARFHWITGRTCGRCGKAMPDTSKGRLCYDCMREEHFFRRGFSCLTYGLYEREVMMDLKYAGKGYLARIFGDMMFDRMEAEIRYGLFSSALPDLEGEHVRIDLIVPVPVSKGRLRRRGYNQSEIMARQFARRWADMVREADHEEDSLFPSPVCRPELLERVRETQMLRSLNPTERRIALQNAFVVPASQALKLKGKRVLLIDDIYTTGATCDACSQAMLEGGASEVFLLTLASGGNRRPADLESDRRRDTAVGQT